MVYIFVRRYCSSHTQSGPGIFLFFFLVHGLLVLVLVFFVGWFPVPSVSLVAKPSLPSFFLLRCPFNVCVTIGLFSLHGRPFASDTKRAWGLIVEKQFTILINSYFEKVFIAFLNFGSKLLSYICLLCSSVVVSQVVVQYYTTIASSS